MVLGLHPLIRFTRTRMLAIVSLDRPNRDIDAKASWAIRQSSRELTRQSKVIPLPNFLNFFSRIDRFRINATLALATGVY